MKTKKKVSFLYYKNPIVKKNENKEEIEESKA